ncbi:leukemia inhibitory factor-like [Trichechus inunguis]
MELGPHAIAQGEPFPSYVDKMCGHGLMYFLPFHAHGRKKGKLIKLYHIITYLDTSLDNITRDQKSLNPQDQNLHSKLNFTAAIMQKLLSNILCLLSKKYQVGHVDASYDPNTSGKDVFQKKLPGCHLLFKYKQVIA